MFRPVTNPFAAAVAPGSSSGQDVSMTPAQSTSSPSTDSAISQISQQSFQGRSHGSSPDVPHQLDVEMTEGSTASSRGPFAPQVVQQQPTLQFTSGTRSIIVGIGINYIREGTFLNDELVWGRVTNQPMKNGFLSGELRKENGKTVINGIWIASQATYNGFVVNGEFEGSGKYKFINANGQEITFTGQFQDGKFLRGTVTNLQIGNGYYSGELSNAEPNGVGRYQEGNLVREGFFENGKLMRGKVENEPTDVPQTTFSGNIENGNKQGRGVLNTSDRKLEGIWVQGKLEGPVLITLNGSKMTFNFRNGVADLSYVEILFNDKSAYIGSGKLNGLMHGRGVLTLPDGTKMEGFWEDGQKNGVFLCTFRDGRKHFELWRKGEKKMNGIVRLIKDGHPSDVYCQGGVIKTIYQGAIQDGTEFARHGRGTLWRAVDEATVTGNWKEDKAHGEFDCVRQDGNIFKEYWFDGRRVSSEEYFAKVADQFLI